MYHLWSMDTIQKKVIGQSLLPFVRDLLAAVEAAGLAASEKRRHPDKAVHSYNFDVDWYLPEEVWLVDLGKDLVYWLTEGRSNLPGFAPHLERELDSRPYRRAMAAPELLAQRTYSKCVHYSPPATDVPSRSETVQEAEPSSIHKAAMGRAVSRSPKESRCSPA